MSQPQPPPFRPGGPPPPPGSGAGNGATSRPVGWMVAVFLLAVLAAVSVTALVMTVILGSDESAPPTTDTTPTTADTTTTETTETTQTTTTAAPTTAPAAFEEFCFEWQQWQDDLERFSDVGPWIVDRWANLNATAQAGPPEVRADVGLVSRYYADLEAGGFELGATTAESDAEFLAASERIEDWAVANC